MRAILTAEGISALGSHMSFLALPWFVLTSDGGSATRMGTVLTVGVLPTALLGIPAAEVVQRLGVRRTLLLSDVCRAPLFAAIPLLQLAGLLSFPALLALVFMIGAFTAPYMSAQRLLIPETFADEPVVVRGNALLEGVIRLGMLLGPAIAGVTIAGLGAPNVLLLDAVSFLVAFVILKRGLPVSPVPPVARSTVDSAADSSTGIFAGARFALADRTLRRITATALAFGLFYPPLLASLPVLTAQRYGADSRVAGLLYAAMGGGALIGTLLVLRLARAGPMRLAAVGAVGLAVPLWLLVLEIPAWQFAVVMFISGMFTPILNAPLITQMMLRAPLPVRAKVLSFVLTTNLLAGPVAYAVTGPALDQWGLTRVYLVIALGVSFAAALMLRLAWHDAPPEGTAQSAPEPVGAGRAP